MGRHDFVNFFNSATQVQERENAGITAALGGLMGKCMKLALPIPLQHGFDFTAPFKVMKTPAQPAFVGREARSTAPPCFYR